MIVINTLGEDEMMNKKIIALGLIASAFVFNTAFAGDRDPNVNKRQHHQHERIAQGVKSGELTHSEVKDLRADQRELRQKERAYKADGQLTKAERVDLQKDLNANSKEIYADKHNTEVRH
jgi:hypothetical protein